MPIWTDIDSGCTPPREYIPERSETRLCEGEALTRCAESQRRAINLRILSRYQEGVHAISATMLISPRDNLYPDTPSPSRSGADYYRKGQSSAADVNVNHERDATYGENPGSSRLAREHRRLNIE